MARVTAAKAMSHADTVWSGYRFGDGKPSKSGDGLRRLAFVVCAICLVSLVAFVGSVTASMQERLVDEATADLDIFARLVSRDLQDDIRPDAALSLGESFNRIVPRRLLTHGRRVLLTDAKGRVAAAFPPLPTQETTLADVLGARHNVASLMTSGGVMRVTLPDGAPALATLRKLPAPFGQVAMIYPIDNVLGDWRAAAAQYALLFAVTTAMLLMIVYGYFRQSRERQAVEAINATIRRRLDTALSSGRCGLWDWDVKAGRIYWSDSMYEMLGLPAEGRSVSFAELNALIHPDDGDLSIVADLAQASKTKTIEHEFRARHANGRWIWLRARAQLIEENTSHQNAGPHLVGIAVDISEQHELAEHKALASARLSDAIESISEAFVLWDSENRLVACNSKFIDHYALTAEQATKGASYAQVMRAARAPVAQIETSSAALRASDARTCEARLADGRWLQINERRTKDGGHVSVGADITALKRNEEQLRDSERRLTASVADLTRSRQMLEMQAQQLATLAEEYHHQKAAAEAAYQAKSAFLANMSHELRTPLNAIIGFAEMMQAEPFGALGSPKYLEYCNNIHKGGSYLNDVLSDILDMSMLETGQMRLDGRELRITDAIRRAVAPWRARIEEKRLRLDIDCADGLQCVGDLPAIVKALGALVSNSVKFTEDDGGLHIRARRCGDMVALYVADTGRGIDAPALSRLGRPFEQNAAVLENGMKGSGLGLAIARALIDLHGGALRMRSQPGVGTVAMIRLPCATMLSQSRNGDYAMSQQAQSAA
jgi:two-component system cell cycle sensor histidine kinase PleC